MRQKIRQSVNVCRCLSTLNWGVAVTVGKSNLWSRDTIFPFEVLCVIFLPEKRSDTLVELVVEQCLASQNSILRQGLHV